MPPNTPIQNRKTFGDFVTQIESLSRLVTRAELDPSYLNRHAHDIVGCGSKWVGHYIGDNIQGLQSSIWQLEPSERITAHLALNALQLYFLKTIAGSRMVHAAR